MARDVSWRTPKRRLFSTPLPVETRTYKPISHKLLAKTTIKAIKESGFTVGNEEYFSAREGMVANARYTIVDIADDDMQLEIGWQNSYDKTLSLKFAIGTRIFICENGCVSGNFGAFAKKHMGDIKIFAPEEMKSAISDAAGIFEKMKQEKDAMKSIIISDRQKGELVGRLFLEKKFIGSTQLNIIRDEINHPTHDYLCTNSLWELYQYVTFSMKELHPRLWMDDHISVHQFFTEVINEKEKIHALSIDIEALIEKDDIDPAQINLLDVIEEEELKIKEDGSSLDKS